MLPSFTRSKERDRRVVTFRPSICDNGSNLNVAARMSKVTSGCTGTGPVQPLVTEFRENRIPPRSTDARASRDIAELPSGTKIIREGRSREPEETRAKEKRRCVLCDVIRRSGIVAEIVERSLVHIRVARKTSGDPVSSLALLSPSRTTSPGNGGGVGSLENIRREWSRGGARANLPAAVPSLLRSRSRPSSPAVAAAATRGEGAWPSDPARPR